MWQKLYNALFSDWSRDAEARQIARHIAQIALYELKGVDTLYSDLKEKYERLEAKMASLGKPIRFVEGFRTCALQEKYFNEGKSKAHGLEGWHNYCLAVDVCFRDYGWKPPMDKYRIVDGQKISEWWFILRDEARKLGLRDIGIWDAGHFELPISNLNWQKLKPYFVDK